MIDIEIALTKDERIRGLINNTRKQRVVLSKDKDGVINSTVVEDLNVGTSYYFRATVFNAVGAESVPGVWSDRLVVDCPPGADCIDNTTLVNPEIVGIDADHVRARRDFYRLPESWAGDNLTFVQCFGTRNGDPDTACLGGTLSDESCKSGYTGLMCGQCASVGAKKGREGGRE